jgi:NADH-ubiquinone oxidoreductase chain 5
LSLITIFSCIILYRFNYFSKRVDFLRFFFLLFFFFISILILIFHNNGLILFLGWDGLGVTSYLLVCYYFNWKSLNGAIVTLITNRLGDVCLFWFVSNVILYTTSLNTFFFYSSPVFILLIGAFTKRAQTPFRRWLPQAIRAPTPVSSLVHRRTLVTAGIFLFLKYFLFINSRQILLLLLVFGTTTIFFAGLAASVEKDTKKIVALRTLSQMGLLTFSVGASIPLVCFFHLLIHAFFKSCMFIQVGFIIGQAFGSQDNRCYSGVSVGTPVTFFFFTRSAISLCGLIFMRGFLRKDILVSFVRASNIGFFFIIFFILGIIFTFIYTAQILTFLVNSAPRKTYITNSLRINIISSAPLFFIGCFGGFFMSSNILFQLGGENFCDKWLPFLFLFSFLLLTLVRVNFTGQFNNICFLDTVYPIFNWILYIPSKGVDIYVDQIFKNILIDIQKARKKKKLLNTQWPLGGFLLVFFFLCVFF